MNEVLHGSVQSQLQLTEANGVKQNDEHQDEGPINVFLGSLCHVWAEHDSFILSIASLVASYSSLVVISLILRPHLCLSEYETNLLTCIFICMTCMLLFHLLDASTTLLSTKRWLVYTVLFESVLQATISSRRFRSCPQFGTNVHVTWKCCVGGCNLKKVCGRPVGPTKEEGYSVSPERPGIPQQGKSMELFWGDLCQLVTNRRVKTNGSQDRHDICSWLAQCSLLQNCCIFN